MEQQFEPILANISPAAAGANIEHEQQLQQQQQQGMNYFNT
jgi:hypothetical protein